MENIEATKENKKRKISVSTLIDIITILGVLLKEEIITKYPEYRNWVVLCGIVWILSAVLKIFFEKKLNDDEWNSSKLWRNLGRYIYIIVGILKSSACVLILIAWFKYCVYPPVLKAVENGFYITIIYAYEEKERAIYPKVYGFVDGEGKTTAYIQWIVANEITQSISIESIQVNILNYEYADNLFTFAKTEEGGGSGTISDHVYHIMLDPDNPHKKMDYCGDYTLDDIEENFVFEPVSSHVDINGNEMDFFDFTFGIEKAGIYTFEIEINYIANGERRSEKIKKYQLYFPMASKLDDRGSFDLYKESSKEARYLYNHIKNRYGQSIVLSTKMNECVRTLKDIYDESKHES